MKKKITEAFCFILYTKSLGISGHFRDDNLDTYGSSHLVGSEIRKKKNSGFAVSHDYRSRVSSRIPDGQTSIAAQKKQWEQQSERAVNY